MAHFRTTTHPNANKFGTLMTAQPQLLQQVKLTEDAPHICDTGNEKRLRPDIRARQFGFQVRDRQDGGGLQKM